MINYDREEIANKLADEGWCPDSNITYDKKARGYNIIKEMFISDTDIDDYIINIKTDEGKEIVMAT